MKKSILSILVLLFFFINQINAQVFTNYNTANTSTSIGGNFIRVSAIDSEGNIWFGTEAGVSKFDGTIWTNYTVKLGLAGKNVVDIELDKEGNLWFGTVGYEDYYGSDIKSSGVSKFDGKIWINYNTDNGLISNNVTAIETDFEGNIWFGTDKGVSMFDGKDWITYTSEDGLVANGIYSIAIDSSGNIWFGTEVGASLFNGTDWTTLTTEDGLAYNSVSAITVVDEGTIWFGHVGGWCNYGGVSIYDDFEWKYYNIENGLAGNCINSITLDMTGNIWLGTNEGASMYDGVNWTNYTTQEGLVDYAVFDIDVDNEGNIWFSCGGNGWCGDYVCYDFEGGITKYDGTNWTNYLPNGLVHNNVTAISTDKEGNMWFGTSNGISKFDGVNWNAYKLFEDDWIESLAIDNEGNIWFSRFWAEILFKYNGTNFEHYTTEDRLSETRPIAIDAEGNIWVGSLGGVYKFDGKNWTDYTTEDGLVHNSVNVIAIDSSANMWFGTESGISKFDGSNWTNYTIEDGLADNNIKAISCDAENNIWVIGQEWCWFECNSGGLSKFDGESWVTYTDTIVFSKSVSEIAIDKCGNVWLGCGYGSNYHNGIIRFDGVNWETYSTEDGLASNITNAIVSDTDGNIWIGTNNGVSNVNCDSISTLLVSFVSDTTLILEPAANSIVEFTITSNTDWTISGLESWLTADITSGSGDATITLTAEENTSTESRTDTIVVSGTGVSDQYVIVTQNGTPTGLSKQQYLGITIYPNPVNNSLVVEGLRQQTIGSIYNANGQMIWNSEIGADKGEINVSGLPSGMYILKMNVDDGVVVKRFTKE